MGYPSFFNKDAVNETIRNIQYIDRSNKAAHKFAQQESSELGISIEQLTDRVIYKDVKELLQSNSNMILAECCGVGELQIDHKKRKLKKGDILVLHISAYKKLKYTNEIGNKLLKPSKIKFRDIYKRYTGQDLTNKSLLIWRTGGIGDLMFSQPIVQHLKEKYPTCRIVYSTSPVNSFIFKAWPKNLINNVLPMPIYSKDLKRYDYHLTFESAIERCEEAKHVNCYEIFRDVSGLEFDLSKYPIKLNLPLHNKNKFKKYVPDNTVIIQMRASSPIRTLPYSKWVTVIKELLNKGFNVGVIDDCRKYEFYEDYKKEHNIPELINLSKYSTTIFDGISIVSNSVGLICIDSSFTHIAAALRLPVVGIYGPFNGYIRMKYYDTASWIDVENFNDCGKFPCYYHQDELMECPYIKNNQDIGCMNSINEYKITECFFNLLEKVKNGRKD